MCAGLTEATGVGVAANDVMRIRRPGRGTRRPRGRERSRAPPRRSTAAGARPRPRRSTARADARSARRLRDRAPRPSRPPRGSHSAARRTARARPRRARAAPAAQRAQPRLLKSPSPSASSQKKRGPFSGAPSVFGSGKGLDRLDVRSLQALVALHDLELDLLTLGQRLVAFPCNRREVDEDVLAALALDEAVALLVREPLDGALGQLGTPFLHKQRRPGHRAADLVKRREG